ncbi:hypothetical protein ZIOFF_065716 [Zingiber officinale]|uniref:Uncharacterized protein n=1 Tax=Zingiber officinale TaxID=94328 RepID=A0A8J5K788_ZINOF|nr:hypothetical protein ZIOFF_065716 [Zingiber officinale]
MIIPRPLQPSLCAAWLIAAYSLFLSHALDPSQQVLFTPCLFLSLSQNPTLRRLLPTALFVASLLTTLFASSLLTTLFAASLLPASLLTTLFVASFLAAIFVASTFGLATSSSRPLLSAIFTGSSSSPQLSAIFVASFSPAPPPRHLDFHPSSLPPHYRSEFRYLKDGHFDDVERAPILPSKPPKETKEMDENKSKKGLAEIYEEKYAQKTGLAPALLSASDKLKIELDALSHFHFAPKPVIEDMSIQVNVPALAMEEVAPLAVSDAAMLAPEEIFHGKGNIKEEAELTKEERKRRRANQKRRFRRLKEGKVFEEIPAEVGEGDWQDECLEADIGGEGVEAGVVPADADHDLPHGASQRLGILGVRGVAVRGVADGGVAEGSRGNRVSDEEWS